MEAVKGAMVFAADAADVGGDPNAVVNSAAPDSATTIRDKLRTCAFPPESRERRKSGYPDSGNRSFVVPFRQLAGIRVFARSPCSFASLTFVKFAFIVRLYSAYLFGRQPILKRKNTID